MSGRYFGRLFAPHLLHMADQNIELHLLLIPELREDAQSL
jgi:hypothetical protein